jgi:phospholipid N-methyltransferase
VGFLREFISQPITTGAVAPSSSFLARMMIEGLDLRNVEAVLEYGPGTGVFTDHILREMNPGGKFAAIELNPQFAATFKARHPQAALFQDSVENAREICDRAGIMLADCIVSGLPWAVFPKSMQIKFLDEMMRVLKPGGRFVTFSYVHSQALPPAKIFASLLNQYFTAVSKSPIVWLNMPPAFVYRCRR